MATTKKAAPKKKAAAKKAPVKKAVVKKVVAKKAVVKKVVPKKTPAKKAVAVKKAPVKKVVAKKAAPKKVVAKKAPAKKVAAAPKKKAGAIKEKMTKTQIFTEIAESVDLSRKQVAAVFDELESLVARSISKRGLGEFTVPGLMKVTTVKKPAKKARKGVNPFTGEEQVFKAKPASMAVKVRPLKKLKEFAAS
ncbi:MAG: nucleoid DNA-binding protein [Paraglaciecola psychrophila]|jgi:nucleoid DNA-binding protein